MQLYMQKKRKRSGDDNTSRSWSPRTQNVLKHQSFGQAYKVNYGRCVCHIKFAA